MAHSLSAAVFSFPLHRPPPRRHLAAIPANTSVPKLSSRRSFVLVGGMPPSGAGIGRPSGRGGTPGPDPRICARGNFPGFPLSNIPVWARWFLGSIFCVAIVPFYRRFRSIQQGVEKTAEVAEEVAKVVKKVAEDIAQALPEDGSLKKVVLEVEEIANEVIADAEEAKSIVDKVEEITEEVEAVAEPIIKELEAHEKEGKQ